MTMMVCSGPGNLHRPNSLWIVVVLLLRSGFVMEIDKKDDEMIAGERSTDVVKE
jgi:hypothetical protein